MHAGACQQERGCGWFKQDENIPKNVSLTRKRLLIRSSQIRRPVNLLLNEQWTGTSKSGLKDVLTIQGHFVRFNDNEKYTDDKNSNDGINNTTVSSSQMPGGLSNSQILFGIKERILCRKDKKWRAESAGKI